MTKPQEMNVMRVMVKRDQKSEAKTTRKVASNPAIAATTPAFAKVRSPSQIAPVIPMRGAIRPAKNHKNGIANNMATAAPLSWHRTHFLSL